MATQVTRLTIVYRDTEGKDRAERLYYKVGEVNTVAIAATLLDELSALIYPVTKCTIVDAWATFPLTPAADAAGAEDNYTNDRGARLSFKTTANRGWSVYIPGFDLDKISNETVEQGAAGVNNLINALLTGGGITNGYKMTDDNGNYMSIYKVGEQVTRG